MARRLSGFDRLLLRTARWVTMRVMARNYDAASHGRRTIGWRKSFADATSAIGPALADLRAHSRDLVRNDGWARNAKRIITRNTVGTGIVSKPIGAPQKAVDAWREWSESTQCDAAGRLTFAGLQKLVLGGIYEGGEMVIRRRWRRPEDGVALPFQLQVLEGDYIDSMRHGFQGVQGGPTLYGIEFDAIGRRVAYWLFDQHPGSSTLATPTSRRIPASDILHPFDLERAGQERGVPWPVAAISRLKDYGEFEGAQLVKQRLAALFTAFETDMGSPVAAMGDNDDSDEFETMEPGTIVRMAPGRDVKFSNPPITTDDGYSVRTLRGIAAAIGITYEDLTGDYSQVNFSSARMSRIAHWGNVWDWQWNMLIPQFCDPVWSWAMEGADLVGLLGRSAVRGAPRVAWTPQPMPLTDPDKEARANLIMIRSGQKTLPEVIREAGYDPDEHLEEIAETQKKLDELGITLDSDPRRTTQTGQAQQQAESAMSALNGKANGAANGAVAPADDSEDEAVPEADA